MATPLILVEIIKKLFPQRLRLAALTRHPVLGAVVERLMFEGDELYYLPRGYLPRGNVVEVGEDIAQSGAAVLPAWIAEYFVNKSSYRFIMNSCVCREAEGCTVYPSEIGCLFLGEGARGINPKLGHPATKEEALEHLAWAKKAGLVQLVGKNKLDTLWLGTGPGSRLMTMCFCCPCCCLWKIAPFASPSISGKLHRLPGVEVRRNDECDGCGLCVYRCMFGAIRVGEGRAQISEACRGCGICVYDCPKGALEIRLPDEASIAGVIRSLSRAVDVS